jgi:hypothetical protein
MDIRKAKDRGALGRIESTEQFVGMLQSHGQAQNMDNLRRLEHSDNVSG